MVITRQITRRQDSIHLEQLIAMPFSFLLYTNQSFLRQDQFKHYLFK